MGVKGVSRRHRALSATIGMVLGLGLLAAPWGQAASSRSTHGEDLPPVDMSWLDPPPTPTEDSSRFVINDSQIVGSLISGASELIGYLPRRLPDDPNNIDGLYCDGYDHKNCRDRELSVRAHLPPCQQTTSAQCIESVTFSVDGEEYPAEFVRYLDFSGPLGLDQIGVGPDGFETLDMYPVGDISADEARGLPAGVNVGLWRVPGLIDGSDHLVAVDLGLSMNVSAKGGKRVTQFGGGVTPVLASARPSQFAPALAVFKNPNGHRGVSGSGLEGWSEDCAYRDVNSCYLRTDFPAGTRVTLVGHVTSEVSGWLHGRIADPEISVSRVSHSVERLSVSGVATLTPATQRTIANRLLPPRWALQREPWFTGEGVWAPGMVLSAVDGDQFRWFKGIMPWLGDKSDALLPTWSFRAVEKAGALDRCLKSSSELVGLVTTSAMMYDGGPPRFEGGRLQYQVAGLHLDPAGDVARGNYSLVMRSKAARCLYGFSNAPIAAEISVYSEDGTEQVATTSVSEGGGWLKLTAENFTFSSPTIEMTLSGTVTKVTLTCLKTNKKVKGPKKVIVTGTSAEPPKCPKGYRAR